MIQKKICMVGAFATGKTSLVAKFVHSIFSEKYQTTVGVKIDRKIVNIEDQDIKFIIWDIYGEDDFQEIRASYLRGSSGYLLVLDSTGKNTLDKAIELQQRIQLNIGKVPFVIVINKADVAGVWEIDDKDIQQIRKRNWTFTKTSAKTGLGVEKLFQTLARKIMEGYLAFIPPLFYIY